MKYTASDLADWWDGTAEEYWQQQDDFIIDAYQLGNAHPVFVFAHWFGQYVGSVPRRVPLAIAGGLADVLRLGNDLSFDSAGDAAKGVALNLLRVLSVLQPATGYIKKEIRHKGLLALAELAKITGKPKAPCQFTAFNNLVSFLKGAPVQHFADLRDIIAVGGSAKQGMYIKELLEHPTIIRLVTREGIKWKTLHAAKTIDDVIAAAKQSDSMVRFTFKWIDGTGKKAAHAVVAVRDLKGNIRIVDYVQGKTAAPGGMGYASWAEMVEARVATWGQGLRSSQLSTNVNDLPAEFTSTFIQIVHLADDTVTLALPVAMGIKWMRGGPDQSFDQAADSITKAAIEFFENRLRDKAPPRPEDLYSAPVRPPEMPSLMFTHTVEGPRIQEKDWLSNIAKKWYGDVLLWPVLFDFNKGPDFTNPNKMYVGQRVKVPFITDKTPAEIAEYRRRGYDWR